MMNGLKAISNQMAISHEHADDQVSDHNSRKRKLPSPSSGPSPKRRKILSKLFADALDARQCRLIFDCLEVIYATDAKETAVLLLIAEFATGSIETCQAEKCHNEIAFLPSTRPDRKYARFNAGFCEKCKPNAEQCGYSWWNRYDEADRCEEVFIRRTCDCGGSILFCAGHSTTCRECGSRCCTNQPEHDNPRLETWTCSSHRTATCRSCGVKSCMARLKGDWCCGCGYVCGECIEDKCTRGENIFENDDNNWTEYCLQHKRCAYPDRLGICQCSKQCTLRLCGCLYDECTMIKDKMAQLKCLVCCEDKKYYKDHLSQERRFVCHGTEDDGDHWCGHGVFLDCPTAHTTCTKKEEDSECIHCGEKCVHDYAIFK